MERFFPQDQRYRTTSASPRTAGGPSRISLLLLILCLHQYIASGSMCRRFVQSINFASEKFFDSCCYCQYKTPFTISSYSWFRYAPTIRRRHPTTNDGRDAEKAPSLRNGSRDFRCRCLCRPTPVSQYAPRSFAGVWECGGEGVPSLHHRPPPHLRRG